MGGHERFDRLGRYACQVLDAVGRAVVAVVPVQPGHGGDVLFGVRRTLRNSAGIFRRNHEPATSDPPAAWVRASARTRTRSHFE